MDDHHDTLKNKNRIKVLIVFLIVFVTGCLIASCVLFLNLLIHRENMIRFSKSNFPPYSPLFKNTCISFLNKEGKPRDSSVRDIIYGLENILNFFNGDAKAKTLGAVSNKCLHYIKNNPNEIPDEDESSIFNTEIFSLDNLIEEIRSGFVYMLNQIRYLLSNLSFSIKSLGDAFMLVFSAIMILFYLFVLFLLLVIAAVMYVSRLLRNLLIKILLLFIAILLAFVFFLFPIGLIIFLPLIIKCIVLILIVTVIIMYSKAYLQKKRRTAEREKPPYMISKP